MNYADELQKLLNDEDLTAEKLQAASESLLPNIADYLHRININETALIKVVRRITKKELIKRYITMRDNVRWHMDTNKPDGVHLLKCIEMLEIYNEIILDLQVLFETGWVKATERLPPPPFINKSVKIDGHCYIAYYSTHHDGWVNPDGDYFPNAQIEWLEEL